MPKARTASGMVVSLLIVALWFVALPWGVKLTGHSPEHFGLLADVALSEAGIVIAMIVGMLVDGGFRISLNQPQGKRWIEGVAIPVIFVWHILASMVFSIIYYIAYGGHIPKSPITARLAVLKDMNIGVLLVTVFLIAGMAAVFEELLYFRGYLISRLKQLGMHPLAAGVIAGILFMLVHVPGYGLFVSIPKFLGLGLIAGLYVGWRGRLWPGMIAHFVIDFGSLLLAALVVGNT